MSEKEVLVVLDNENGTVTVVYTDGTTERMLKGDELEEVVVVGKRLQKDEKPKWWQQYDSEKSEQARLSWNQWMPQDFRDYSNPKLFNQLGNTSSNSSTPKALQTSALGGNEPWQQQVFQPSAYDRYDYSRDARLKAELMEQEQKAENDRLKRLSMFLVSNPQYKHDTPRTGKIVKTIPYRGTRRLHLSEKDRTELRKGMLEQLAHYDLDKTYQTSPKNIQDFFNDNFDRTEIEIITQRKDASKTFLGSQKGGPRIRYIQDPINPDAVIDLRHMLVVGKKGEFIGNSVELGQSAAGMSSGANYQDYYSNYLGYQFYKVYGNKLKQNSRKFAQYLYDFLTSNQYGRLDTNGDINYYE